MGAAITMPRRGRNSAALPAAGVRVQLGVLSKSVKGDCRMAEGPRLRSLVQRHAVLERQIGEEDARPKPDESTLIRLKLEKLRLKEEIERLRRGD
jgi:hypothetical protein